jgi:protein-tyrosine phosphatase
VVLKATTETQSPQPDPNGVLLLAGTFNVRDLGGYPTRDGGVIRPRTIYRADSLHRLTPEAQATLERRGLRTVIDLRRADESAAAPNVFRESLSVIYRNIPLPGDLLLDPTGTPPPLAAVYRAMLDKGRTPLRQILVCLSDPACWPVLVHCTAGKDRTGLVTALLLGIAEVPDEAIVADYALTSRFLSGALFEDARRDAEARGYRWATTPALLASPPVAMADTLTYLRTRYGGPTGYACSLGLRDRQIARIRAALLSD